MKPLLLDLLAAAAFALPAAAETRCGWVVNPTPANWWLTDSEGEWILSTQGGVEADGMELLPDFTTGDWVVTNGSSYGYGCACMGVTTNRAEGRITKITSVRQLKLAKCEADPALPAVQ